MLGGSSRSQLCTFQRTSHVNYPEEGPIGLLSRREATNPTHHRKGAVAEIGAHGMGLEQAGKLNNTKITSDYWSAKKSKTDVWGRVKKHSRNVDRTTDLLEVRAKYPEESQLRNTVPAATAVAHRRLRQHLSTATVLTHRWTQLQHHATASYNIFRCATECKSRHLNYKK